MNELNLPAYDVKLRGTREKPEILDFLRRRYVALTPEEWVRQHFTHWLVEHKGYPQGLLGNEIALSVRTAEPSGQVLRPFLEWLRKEKK